MSTLKGKRHDNHQFGPKRADVYTPESIAQFMIRGQMPNDGTPDPFGNNETPDSALEKIQDVATRLDSMRTHKIQK